MKTINCQVFNSDQGKPTYEIWTHLILNLFFSQRVGDKKFGRSTPKNKQFSVLLINVKCEVLSRYTSKYEDVAIKMPDFSFLYLLGSKMMSYI